MFYVAAFLYFVFCVLFLLPFDGFDKKLSTQHRMKLVDLV